jgi:inorganic triphosphatase YgiF
MNPPRNSPAEISGLCWFMLQRLPPLLDAFAQEIEGVRLAEDIEYIHRMRVASRRLRAAFPLFASCFPQKQYGRWMAEIAGITRALGEARDADVQIAFLTKFQKKRLSAWKKAIRMKVLNLRLHQRSVSCFSISGNAVHFTRTGSFQHWMPWKRAELFLKYSKR